MILAHPAGQAGRLALLLLITTAVTAQDAPPVERPLGLMTREHDAFDGYTLFGPIRSNTVYLMNMAGSVVHTWETEHSPGASQYLLDDGSLMRCTRIWENSVFRGGGIGGRLQQIDWDGEVVWDYPLANDSFTQHHDCEPLPNGNVLVIVWERKPPGVAEEAGRDPSVLGKDGLWPDAILEIKPIHPDGGEIVWEWHAWDHLIQDFDERRSNYGVVADHPGLIDLNADVRAGPKTAEQAQRDAELAKQMRELGYVGGGEAAADDDGATDARAGPPGRATGDWLHTNSVDYHAGLDLILLSTPRLHEVWVIDHSTSTEEAAGHVGGRWNHGGDLLYRWGNPAAYDRGRPADRQLFAQHDARWLTGTGSDLRVTVFNNGPSRPGGDHSSVDEIVLPFDGERGFLLNPGEAFLPAAPTWTYEDPEHFFAAFISSAQRLPGGNTLICSGPQGRLFEVTPDGRIVWDYWNAHGGDVKANPNGGKVPEHALFRGMRFAPDHPGLSRL